MLQPEQNSVTLMKKLVQKFSKSDDLGFDRFVGTLSRAKGCHFLDKHRRFVRCENESGCLENQWQGFAGLCLSAAKRIV